METKVGRSRIVEHSVGTREGKESHEASKSVYLTQLEKETFGTAVLHQSKRFRVLQDDDVENQELCDALKYCNLFESWCYEGATKEEIELIQESQLYLLYNIYDDLCDTEDNCTHFSVDQILLIFEMVCRNIHVHNSQIEKSDGSPMGLVSSMYESVFLDRVDGLIESNEGNTFHDAQLSNTNSHSALVGKYKTSEIETADEELIHCVFCIFHAIIGKKQFVYRGKESLFIDIIKDAANGNFIDGNTSVMAFSDSKKTN